MLVNLSAGRRSPITLLLIGGFFVFVFVLYFGRPYVGVVRSKFPELGDKIAAKIESLGSFQRPGAGGHNHDGTSLTPNTNIELVDAKTNAQRVWSKLQPLLDGYPPGAAQIPGWDGLDFTDFDANATAYTEDVLKMNIMDVIRMRGAHREFVSSIQQQFQTYTPSSGSARRGVVTTAAGYYLPVAMVSLRMLRRTGTTLPVEIWMASADEYEPYICEQVLPALNAGCRVLEDIFNHEHQKFKPKKHIEHFQLKIFAILFSSFQEVLWLDADNFPLHEPEILFEAEPFKTTGMIIWPDFWFRTVSPTYHLINDKEPEHRGTRPAAETGQMLLNKATHMQVLLLAAYYNYYGPSHYYGLTCQNGPGRGDKETFIPAAQSLGAPFYQVHQGVKAVGHNNAQNDGIWIFAMIQYDPVQDFHRWQNMSKTHDNRTAISEFDSFDDAIPPTPFFLHCNTPKWNPKNVFDHSGAYDLTWDVHQKPEKAFSHPPEVVATLYGIERAMWDEVRWTACELEGKFKDWTDASDVCSKVDHYFDTWLEPQNGAQPDAPQEATPIQVGTDGDGGVQVNYDGGEMGDELLVMGNNGEVGGLAEKATPNEDQKENTMQADNVGKGNDEAKSPGTRPGRRPSGDKPAAMQNRRKNKVETREPKEFWWQGVSRQGRGTLLNKQQ